MATYTLGPDGWPIDQNGRRATYWEYRRELVYYHTLANFVRLLGHDAKSLIDVGSAGCAYLAWFDWIPDRTSLDLSYPSTVPGVKRIKHDFLTWQPEQSYDLVTCSQVLEHVPDAPAFAKKLLKIGRRVLVSVPYKWPAGSVKGHIHDPVDEAKLESWFERKPSYSLTVREPFGEERLFCFYNNAEALGFNNSEIMNRLLAHPIVKE